MTSDMFSTPSQPSSAVSQFAGQDRTYADRVLTTPRLRSLLRNRRTPLIPESLADYMRYRIPEIFAPDVKQILELLASLVESIRTEFEAAGIVAEPFNHDQASLSPSRQKLSSRERRHAGDFASLLMWTSEAAGVAALCADRPRLERKELNQRSISYAHEAAAWGEMSNDIPLFGNALLIYGLRIHELGESIREAEPIFRKGIDLLESTTSTVGRSLLMRLFNHYATLLVKLGRVSEAEEIIDRASAMIGPQMDQLSRLTHIRLLTLQLRLAQQRNDLETALRLAQKALSWSDPDIGPLPHAALLQGIAHVYRQMEHSEQEIRYLVESIALLETSGTVHVGSWAYISAIEAYRRIGDLDRAEELLYRIEGFLKIDLNDLPDDPPLNVLSIVLCRAQIMLTRRELEEARPIFEWTIGAARASSYRTSEVAACAMLGSLYRYLEEYDKAIDYMEQAIAASEHSSRFNQLRLVINLAEARVDNNQTDRGTELLDSIEQETEDVPPLHIKLLRLRSRICEGENDWAVALQLEREASQLEQEIFTANREEAIRYARIVSESGMLEKVLEQELDIRRRLEHQLADALLRLEEKETIIHEAIRTVREQLPSEGESTNGSRGSSSSNIHSLLSVLTRGEIRSSFAISYLKDSGDDFDRRLREAHPNLTLSQERLCLLIRVRLDSSEICRILGIGAEGLKSRRKRLRKVLNLPQGESLERWIYGI